MVARYVRSARRASPLLAGALTVQLLLLVSGVLTARALGVQGRGIAVLGMLVPTLVAFVAGLGTGNLANVLVSTGSNPRRVLYQCRKACMPFVIAGAALAGTITYVAVKDVIIGAFSAVAVGALVRLSHTTGVLQGSSRFWAAVSVDVLSPMLYSVSLLILFFSVSALSPRTVIGFWVAAMLIVVVGSTMSFRLGQLRNHVDCEDSSPLSVNSIRSRGARSLIATYSPIESFRLDQIAVVLFAGTIQLGLYSVALAFANLPKLVGQSIAVRVAQLGPRGASRHNHLIFALLAGVLLVGLVTAGLSPLLLPVMFGPEFSPAGLVAVMISLAGGLMGIRKILTEILRSQGREGLGSIAESTAVATFIVLILAPIVRESAYGIAAALAISSAVSVILMFLIWRRRLKDGGLQELS